jgi:hypothetical protein
MPSQTLYLIHRLVQATRYGVHPDGEGVSVLACASRAEAERRRQDLEAEARAVLPPFKVDARPESWSSLGLAGLMARLRELGLPDLPVPSGNAWEVSAQLRHWWDAHAGDLTPQQVAAVWDTLDGMHFYKVVQVRLKE